MRVAPGSSIRLLLYSVPLPMFSLMALMISGNRRESSPNAAIFLVPFVLVDDDDDDGAGGGIIVVVTCTFFLYLINIRYSCILVDNKEITEAVKKHLFTLTYSMT